MRMLASLQQLGLDYKEQLVYTALLQLEKATANEIAYKTNLKRPTTYDILYRLRTDGIVAEIKEGKKRKFVAPSPEQLLVRANEQKRALEHDLPQLLSIYNTKTKRPKVAYFEGIDGIKQLYEDTLLVTLDGGEILAYVTKDTVDALPEYTADYVRRRAARNITLRGIYESSPAVERYLSKNKEQRRRARVLNNAQPLHNEINIYGDRMIIITHKPEPFGVQIESKEIADTQRTIFELAWRSAK